LATKSRAQKEARSAEKKRLRNRSIRSTIKTYITKAERFISSRHLESAQKSVAVAIRALDKAVNKGVIHSNTAARHKSRLMKKLNQALSPNS